MHKFHEHEHNHDHGHSHGHSSEDEQETMALIHYMLHHNEHHAQELGDMAHALRDQGKEEAAKLLDDAIKQYEAGNQLLGRVFELLGE